jgi:superfamily II DNA or RNA helicase
MAQRPSVVVPEATAIPDPSDVERVAAFAHEPFVCEGESADDVLAPGTVRRHAFEFARAELDAGATVPSQKWRRRWSLLLGLDRALHTETPTLADGTTLNPHQVDALSGTYAALLADAQRRTRGAGASDGDALLLSFEDDEGPSGAEFPDEPPSQAAAPEEDEPEDDEPEDDAPDDVVAVDDEFASVPVAADEDEDDDEERPSLEDELEELPDAEPESESALYDDDFDEEVDEDVDAAALDDPNAHKRFWFEHATGAGKTVAAMGFVEACRTGGVLILTHRRNLVDQFIAELQTRGYGERLSKPLLGDADIDDGDPAHAVVGPVTIETYQWFVRNAGQISGAYTVVICDEAHTALGEKTSATIRAWTGPIFIGMTATGALIARHVTDLFPTQTSRFDLAQAARRGVIAPLRSLRIPPGPGVRTIAKVPLRKGEVDMEFDQDELAKLLDQAPFNLAIADLYRTRFRNTPGVVYTAGVQHAYNVAESFRALDMKAEAVSGETPKRELAKILADYEAGEIDVLVNAQLLAEGWNSPRATICMHLAPTASKRIYQQRVGRVTRRHPGKEAGVVIDFVHPATTNDDPVVTLHSLLDRDVYRGGAIVVGPVRRGRGRRVKVERRVLPVTPDIERRRDVFERELWRIAVEQLDWGEQRVWAALAGAKATPTNWRRGRAMLNFDRSGELRRQFLITALERNRNPQLRMRAIQEIAVLREADPFDTAIDFVGGWPREERREASRVLLQAMADRRIGRREQATAWIWRLAEYTRDMHEEYAAQRWPATKHLLGLLVNSSGAAHARNARRLVHAARQHDRRLQAALLAAAVAHTPEAEEVLREARTRLARKPGALSRDLLKDFPSGKRRKKRSRNKKKNGDGAPPTPDAQVQEAAEGQDAATDDGRQPVAVGADVEPEAATFEGGGQTGGPEGGGGGGSRRSRSRRGRSRGGRRRGGQGGGEGQGSENGSAAQDGSQNGSGPHGAAQDDAHVGGGAAGANGRGRGGRRDDDLDVPTSDATPDEDAAPVRRRIRGQKAAQAAADAQAAPSSGEAAGGEDSASSAASAGDDAPRTRRRRRRSGGEDAAETVAAAETAPRPDAGPADADGDAPARPSRRRRRAAAQADAESSPTGGSSDGPSAVSGSAAGAAGSNGSSLVSAAGARGSNGSAASATGSSADRPATPADGGSDRDSAAPVRPVPAPGGSVRTPVRPVAAPADGAALTAAAAKAAPAAASADPDAEHPAKARARAAAAAAPATDDAPAAPARRSPKAPADDVADEAPAPKPARRSRARTADAEAPADEAAVKPATRSRAKAAAVESTADPEVAKPARRSRAKAAEAETPADEAAARPATRSRAKAAAVGDDDAPAAKPATRSRAKSIASTDEATPAAPARRSRTKAAAEAGPGPTDDAPKPAARRSRAKTAPAEDDAPATDAPAKAPARRRSTKAAAAEATTEPSATAPADEAAPKPARRRTTKAAAADEAAPAKKPAARRTTAKPAAATKAPAAKKTATTAKKTTAAKTAPAEADAPATKAAPKRATRKPAAAKAAAADAPAEPATRRRAATTTKTDEAE